MNKTGFYLICFFVSLFALSLKCQESVPVTSRLLPQWEHAMSSAYLEKETILSLAVMAEVYKDWQPRTLPNRGYNIGALLYDARMDTIAFVEKNSINLYSDKTQHAEIRLMQEYLRKKVLPDLEGMHVITTLEPCMMCSGMLIFLNVDTVKYIQADPCFGKNIERLAADWVEQGKVFPGNGRSKRTKSVPVACPAGTLLEEEFREFAQKTENTMLSDFLYAESVESVYRASFDILNHWHVIYPENKRLLENVFRVLNLENCEDCACGKQAFRKNRDLIKRNLTQLKSAER